MVGYRVQPHLSVYAWLDWHRFTADASFAGSNNDFEETGYAVGLQFEHPIARSKSVALQLRAGGIYNHIEVENTAGDHPWYAVPFLGSRPHSRQCDHPHQPEVPGRRGGLLAELLSMRVALSLLFIVHGIAHLPGFLVPWRLAAPAEMPYTTTVFGGTADIGPVGIRIVSILWLLTALAFVVAGVATFLDDAGWRTLAIAATLASLALTVLGWPQSRIGLALNLVLLPYLVWGAKLGWLPGGVV